MNQKTWLRQIVTLVCILVIVYVVPHMIINGERIISLTASQLSDITTLINGPDSLQQSKSAIVDKVDIYLRTSIDAPILSKPTEILRPYKTTEFVTVLTSAKLRLSSFFWLTGDLQAFEIIFWSIFGVLASLLYTGSEAIRLNNFKSSEVAAHIAKLFYAPFCTIVIILSVSVLSGNGDVSVEKFQYWLIVLSFILGFFSGRTIELLNKLKDLILPLGKASDSLDIPKLEVNGKISIAPTIPAGTSIDVSKAAVKLFSMNDPSINDIVNPGSDGSFNFTGLKDGDYVIKAEYKNGSDIFEARKSIKLPLSKDEVIDISLSKTN